MTGPSVGTSSSSSTNDMATMGLGPLIALGAMGGQFGLNQGGLSVTGFPGSPGYTGDGGWLNPESLQGLLQPMNLGYGEQAGLAGIPSSMALNSLSQTNPGISELFANLLGAGQATSIDPIIAASKNFLTGERGRLREEMGAKGSFDTDIYNAYARAEGNVANQLGTLQFQSQEAAKDRAGPGLTAGIAGAAGQINNIMQTFAGLFDLESASRAAARSETEGGRTADIISWLAGLQGPVGNVGQSESEAVNVSTGGMCWGAAVYYGWFTEEWQNARAWIMEGWDTLEGRLFRALYTRYGEQLAEALRLSASLRDYMRPFFVWCERCGRELRYAR